MGRTYSYNEDGTIDKTKLQGDGDRARHTQLADDSDSVAGGRSSAEDFKAMQLKGQDRKREEAKYDRANAKAERRNKRVVQQDMQAARTAAVRKAMSAAPYTNKVQEAKKKQKAKMKKEMKRRYYSG